MENKKIEFESYGIRYTIKARNVGKKNPQATIQIQIERYDRNKECSSYCTTYKQAVDALEDWLKLHPDED